MVYKTFIVLAVARIPSLLTFSNFILLINNMVFIAMFFFRGSSLMRSFMKSKPSRNGEIALSSTEEGESCPSGELLKEANVSFIAI